METVVQDGRRAQILAATLRVIVERGITEARIADVAKEAEVSPALVIYYFKTKTNLITDALRLAEDSWYAEGARRMAPLRTAAERLETVVALTCLPQEHEKLEESWVTWLDLWAAAARLAEVRRVREEFDERWRETIREVVREGEASGEFQKVDVDDFALAFCSLLDGLAIQIALEDSVLTPGRAFDIAMRIASDRLGFAWARSDGRRRTRRQRARAGS